MPNDLLGWIFLGFLAGGISGWFVGTRSVQGCLPTIVVGILGGVIGGWLSRELGYGQVEGFISALCSRRSARSSSGSSSARSRAASASSPADASTVSGTCRRDPTGASAGWQSTSSACLSDAVPVAILGPVAVFGGAFQLGFDDALVSEAGPEADRPGSLDRRRLDDVEAHLVFGKEERADVLRRLLRPRAVEGRDGGPQARGRRTQTRFRGRGRGRSR